MKYYKTVFDIFTQSHLPSDHRHIYFGYFCTVCLKDFNHVSHAVRDFGVNHHLHVFGLL